MHFVSSSWVDRLLEDAMGELQVDEAPMLKAIDDLEAAGLVISGKSVDQSLVEVVELADHPWYVACQFHPEFTSTPRDGHPLFSGFVNAALEHKTARTRAHAAPQE